MKRQIKVNKLSIIAVSMLAVFIGWCGWLASQNEKAGKDEQGSMYRCKRPPPTGPEEILRENKAMFDSAIAEVNSKPFLIKGREIVSSRGNMNDPERYDTAHTMYRAERKLTQVKTD